jgi:hypothetical protein
MQLSHHITALALPEAYHVYVPVKWRQLLVVKLAGGKVEGKHAPYLPLLSSAAQQIQVATKPLLQRPEESKPDQP